MYGLLIALALAAFVAGPAAASDESDVMAVVHQWIDAANKGDVKSFESLCTEQTTIMDDFPPHEWQGPGACSRWFTDYDAVAKANDETDGAVIPGKLLVFSVTGERAYVVTRDSYTFKRKGKPMKQSGSIHTLVLQKGSSGWRITGEAWAATSLAAPVKTGP